VDTNTAFLAYGVHLGTAGEQTDRIDDILATVKGQCPDVHTAFGGFDIEDVFLVTYVKEVKPGGHVGSADISPERQAGWDVQLAHALRTVGYSGRKRPAWLCFTELS
jgi:hypothetical protein